MAATSVQFAVATHLMAALAYRYGEEISSTTLAHSVNADATFIRKSLSKLAKAGLVITTRGKTGACTLAKPPSQITLRDIYRASEAPAVLSTHSYPVENTCAVSSNIHACLVDIQAATQRSVENALSSTTLADIVTEIHKRNKKPVKHR